MKHSSFCLLVLVIVSVSPMAMAQRADVPIESRRIATNDKAVLEKLAELRKAGELLSIEQIRDGLRSPTPKTIELPSPSTQALRPDEIAVRARKSLLRVGWYYLCKRCDNWHLNVANGYGLTEDGIACTCYHVIEPDTATMREGYCFAMNVDGDVFPVKQVLAADRRLDAAIVRLDGARLVPVALNDQTAPGEAAYLFSDPKGFAGYFSAGQINRFFWHNERGPRDRDKLAGVRNMRIDVSTDWAPGSSGAAVLDSCGNAIGHVTTIHAEQSPATPGPITPPPASAPVTQAPPRRPTTNASRATYIVMHQAVPAKGVLLLVEDMNKKAEKP